MTLHKTSRSFRQLARLLLHGATKTTLHVRTLSGAIFGEIADLSDSATADDFVTALKGVRDEVSLATFSKPSSFAPASSLKAIIDSVTVVTPDGKYSIDDVGRSSGYARAKPAVSIRKSISRVLTEETSDILILNTVSGHLVKEIEGLGDSAPLSSLISLVKSELLKTTSISEASEKNITMTSMLKTLSRLVKKDLDGGIFIDDHPLSLNDDHVQFSSMKELFTKVIDGELGGFFFKTALGALAKDLTDLGTPTTGEILGLI